MAHIFQELWCTVRAFLIDTRSLHCISDSMHAIRAMSAVSKEIGIMVQDTCEAAYKQHEVWKMVIPFAVEAWLTTCMDELDWHHHFWCSRCVKENDFNGDTMGPFYFRGCSECDSVRAINVVSKQFQESVGDTYIAADQRDIRRFLSISRPMREAYESEPHASRRPQLHSTAKTNSANAVSDALI